jgi:PucR family transcriptional regulator, purine catabolism regulatory protein
MPHEVGERARTAGSAITVREALALDCMRGAQIVAGASGDGRLITGVNVMEDANIVRWMRGGELLLTTGYTIRDDPAALQSLVPALAERDLAGLVIKLGLYVEAVPDDVVALADRLGFPLVGLPAQTMFDDVLSEVLGTILNRQAVELERSSAIHARLTQVAVDGGSFTELAEAVSELAQRPVAIRDAQGNVLAATDGVPEDDGAPDDDGAHQVVRPIRVGDAAHGEVVMWTGGVDLLPHELMTMEHAATVAAMAIAQERSVVSSEQRHRTLLLMQLVSRQPVDRAEIARWATAMGWDMDRARAVVLVELCDGAGERVRVAGQPVEDRLVRAAQDAVTSQPIVWALRAGLALLVEPRPSLGRVTRDLHAALLRSGAAEGVMVAAGGVAAHVDDLGRSYEEAASTLALGRELSGRDFVLEHEELGVYRLLSRLPLDELRRHRAEAIGPLLEYDRDHNGALVHTLEVFLRCERNRVRAAEELFIHYNTLRYRLGQIDQLTGGLSGDSTARLNLELALCAHRLVLGREEA